MLLARSGLTKACLRPKENARLRGSARFCSTAGERSGLIKPRRPALQPAGLAGEHRDCDADHRGDDQDRRLHDERRLETVDQRSALRGSAGCASVVALVAIVTSAAMPIAPPICCELVTSPERCRSSAPRRRRSRLRASARTRCRSRRRSVHARRRFRSSIRCPLRSAPSRPCRWPRSLRRDQERDRAEASRSTSR